MTRVSRRGTAWVVGRFAVASLVVFAALGIALSLTLPHQLQKRQVLAAQNDAKLIANVVLRPALTPQDLAFFVPFTGSRYEQLRAITETRVLRYPLQHVRLWRDDGTIIFADTSGLVGRRLPLPEAAAAAFRSRIGESTVAAVDMGTGGKVLDTYVPVYLNGESGIPIAVAQISQDYAAIDRSVSALVRNVAVVLVIGLAFLYVVLLPLVRQVARRLSRQNDELGRLLALEQEATEERKRLLEKLLEISEEERTRFAADLHDGPVQRLATVGLTLHRARAGIERSSYERAGELVAKAQGLVSDEIAGLRRMMYDLRPPALEQRGLQETLRDQAEHVARDAGIECSVDCSFREPLDPEVETILYRVAQEALANVVKHAGADRVALALGRSNGSVVLTVRDDGRGFDAVGGTHPSKDHYGLLAMRERVAGVGGTCSVESRPGEGTVVRVEVPRGR